MNILLVFFAIPIAIIILSVILETFIKYPIKVAGIFFAIFLVVAFALGGSAELIVLAIAYTILAFIAAYLTSIICCRRSCCNTERRCCRCERRDFCNNSDFRTQERVLTEPIVRNIYNESVEENNFTNSFNDDNGFTNTLSTNNSGNINNNNCPYRRFR